MDTITILPSSGDDEGSQRCRLGEDLVSFLKAGIGDVVTIDAGNWNYLCTVWPRSCQWKDLCNIDPIVLKQEVQGIGNIKEPMHDIVGENILTKCVQLKPHSKTTELEVTVVLKSFKDVRRLNNLSCQEEFREYVKNILYKRALACGYIVCCANHRLGKLYGTSYIITNKMTTEHSTECGLVDKETIIHIDKIISRERFEQSIQNRDECLVGGLERVIKTLKEAVLLPLNNVDRVKELGIQFPRGFLLRGPPGCGKTTLVKYVAAKTDSYLITVNGPEVFGSRPGESEETLGDCFEKACEISKEGSCILFLDELDALCPDRDKGGKHQESRMVSRLCNLMDGIHEFGNLIVIGATNRPSVIDLSLRRPGRFEKEIFIGVPNLTERNKILKVLTQNIIMDKEVKLDCIAEKTPGFVGADLASLVQQALYEAVREAQGKGDSLERVVVGESHLEKSLHQITPSTQRGSDILVDYKPVRWEQIGGLEHVKLQLQQAVEWPLKHPEAFARLGVALPKGVLLYGPPGCAKTTLVRAAATACNATFLAISGAQLYSPYVGDSEKKLSEVFQQARAGAPSILFIDEIDSVIGKRSTTGKQRGVQERVLSTLLNEMDGVGLKSEDLKHQTEKTLEGAGDSCIKQVITEEIPVNNTEVLLVAATNRPDMLDDALIRPGRIDRMIYVPPPDKEARLEILKVHVKNTPLGDVNLEKLAAETENFTGADLENLCKEAALCALTVDGLDVNTVDHRHFIEALKTANRSLTLEQLQEYQDYNTVAKKI